MVFRPTVFPLRTPCTPLCPRAVLPSCSSPFPPNPPAAPLCSNPVPPSSSLPPPVPPRTCDESLEGTKDRRFHLPPFSPLCTMDACFNFSHCPSPPAHEPLVYSYWPCTKYLARFSATRAALMLAPHLTVHRAAIDVSLPLPPTWKRHAASLRPLPVGKRRYLLAFMGAQYLLAFMGAQYLLAFMGARYLGTMRGSFHRSKAFKGVHNKKDIIVVLTAGAIPVVVADTRKLPFDDIIPWHRCLLVFPTSLLSRIEPTLRAITPHHPSSSLFPHALQPPVSPPPLRFSLISHALCCHE
ncbi:unnamed protein product [Closterium sp. Naga37s-1]|nr:unnamed protein product [Closterium sp. Naga37s-1]